LPDWNIHYYSISDSNLTFSNINFSYCFAIANNYVCSDGFKTEVY